MNKERAKQILNWQVPAVCFGFYAVWSAVYFLLRGKSEYTTPLDIFMLVLILLFPVAFGIFGYIKNKSVIATSIIYFIFTFILWSVMTIIQINQRYWEDQSFRWGEAISSSLLWTLICVITAGITKITIIFKAKAKELIDKEC